MISVDRSALIAILRHEAEADAFLQVIANSDRCLISSVIHQETSMVLAGQDGGEKTWFAELTVLRPTAHRTWKIETSTPSSPDSAFFQPLRSFSGTQRRSSVR